MKTFFVIPAFNEEKRLGKVISGLKKAGYYNLVVIDDCSRDNTAKIAERSGAIVLKHIINRGQGAALRTGIEYALSKGADFIVTFDADGQHRIEDIPAMLSPVVKGSADISVGSRFLSGQKLPLVRKMLLKGSVYVIWLFYGVKMTDAHNGFRVFSRKAAELIEIKSDRMAHASEIIEEIYKKGLRVKEVPVVINYSEDVLKKGHGGVFQAFKVLARMTYQKFIK